MAAVRVLLVLAALGVLYGCSQASSPAGRQEKQGGLEQGKPEEPKEPEEPTEPTEQATVKCEDFISREAAQEYFDTRATEADKDILDPDDNGKACDEGAYLFASEPTAQASTPTSAASPSVPGQPGPVATCRMDRHIEAENMTRSEANAFSNAIADEMLKDIQAQGPDRTIPQILDDMDVPDYGCSAPEE